LGEITATFSNHWKKLGGHFELMFFEEDLIGQKRLGFKICQPVKNAQQNDTLHGLTWMALH